MITYHIQDCDGKCHAIAACVFVKEIERLEARLRFLEALINERLIGDGK